MDCETQERLVTQGELERLLGVSASTIKRMLRDKQIKGYQVRGLRRFRYSEVLEALQIQ